MKGEATEDSPPHNSHFDANSCIKVVPKVAPMPSRSTLNPTHVPDDPPVTPAQIPSQSASVSSTSSVSEMLQLLILQQLQQSQQQQQQQLAYIHSTHLGPTLRTISSPVRVRTPVPSLPSSPVRSPRISLDIFCEHYGISDENKTRLEKLGYVPGN